jgi:hypothetical protein
MPRDFSVTTNELTATLKMKRSVAMGIWETEIDAMYK